MGYKQGVQTYVAVQMRKTADGTGKTLLTYSDVTVYLTKHGSNVDAVKNLIAADWVEPGVAHKPGVYWLRLSAADLDTLGQLVLSVEAVGCFTYPGLYEVVANLEADTFARVGAPVGASLAADVAAIPTTPLLAGSYTAPDNAGIAAIQASTGSLAADIATRAPASTALSNATWTDIRAGKIDFLDAAVSTAGDAATLAAIKAKTDNLPLDPADESSLQAAIATRLATASYVAPNNAGIAAIPTNPVLANDARLNNLDASVSSVLAGIAALPVPASVLDALLTDHLTENSIGHALAIIRGMVQHNFKVDQAVYNSKKLLTSSRIRIFNSAADTNSGVNPLATYLVTSTPQSAPNEDMPSEYKVTKV